MCAQLPRKKGSKAPSLDDLRALIGKAKAPVVKPEQDTATMRRAMMAFVAKAGGKINGVKVKA